VTAKPQIDAPPGALLVARLVEEALEVAEADSRRALQLLADAEGHGLASADLRVRGLAAWARGRASRHLGQQRRAGVDLRDAVDMLRRSSDVQAWARASVSLALERIDAGCFDEAIGLLDSSSTHLSGGDAARALTQKALAVQRAGQVVDSLENWDRAIEACSRAGLLVEQAVAMQNRGIVHVYRGDLDAAEADLQRAAAIFERCGQEVRSMEVTHNLGFVASRRGDLPKALELFD
jgi:tetratricopeptide (TPR) repeat protein